ncbi:hypothetical protein E5K00_04900 [Hymenobacter aquaticus]|uniref:Lanthionine synthetase C family protein n=1 Tax=Hymenobacter aquaticus TaxID=1867101 RepID=A0A4Z0Q4N0_9BACT|nr:lanthionine synthetase LanC family protein [Hymenobacter aquaticus]TGE24554.1 hypothetical protein E5K00_04900 [Hymenobacter aquaticus]
MIEQTGLARRVRAKIQEIQAALTTTPPPPGQALSLMAGPGGSILYYFYMAKMQDSGELYDHAFALLEQALDTMEHTAADSLTYCDGIVGFGVLFQLLATEGLIDAEADDVLLALDELIVAYTVAQLQAGNLDFLHGAIGNGFYLLSRLGTPATDHCLYGLISCLRDTAVRDAAGIRWHDQASGLNNFAAGAVDLGLAHGLSSKLVFLARCIGAGVRVEDCTRLLTGGIHYLLRQAGAGGPGNIYPSIIPAAGSARRTSRLAWCYGDLCVCTALLFAGKALANADWVRQAYHLARGAAERTTPERTAISDAGFCHGTAGVAHIFNRLYLESRHDDFRKARDYWLEQTLEHTSWPAPPAEPSPAPPGSAPSPGSFLLEGLMGTSLVLQSCLATTPEALAWDAVFLLNFS